MTKRPGIPSNKLCREPQRSTTKSETAWIEPLPWLTLWNLLFVSFIATFLAKGQGIDANAHHGPFDEGHCPSHTTCSHFICWHPISPSCPNLPNKGVTVQQAPLESSYRATSGCPRKTLRLHSVAPEVFSEIPSIPARKRLDVVGGSAKLLSWAPRIASSTWGRRIRSWIARAAALSARATLYEKMGAKKCVGRNSKTMG